MSKKVKLDVNDIAILDGELRNAAKEVTISFDVKYDIAKVIEQTAPVLKNYNEQRNNLINELGTEKTKGKKDFFLEKGTLKGDKGFKQLEDLMAKEEEITAEFKYEDFAELKSGNSYIQLMKFLIKTKMSKT